jgi:hypothetical protein
MRIPERWQAGIFNQEHAYQEGLTMTSDESKMRHVERADLVGPLPDNPVVHLLRSHKIPWSRISGRAWNAGAVYGEEFKDFEIYYYGVSGDEGLPTTPLFWEDNNGGGYYCWQIQIYWKTYGAHIEAMWSEEYQNYEVVTLWGGLGQLDKQLATGMNKGINLLILISERMSKGTHGGPNNVKVANLPKHIKEALGSRYVGLLHELENVKQDAKTFFRTEGDKWRSKLLDLYQILESHDDLLKDIHPYFVPSDSEATNRIYEQWEIAIEIAAREKIPNYIRRSVTPRSLKNCAVLPDNNTSQYQA